MRKWILLFAAVLIAQLVVSSVCLAEGQPAPPALDFVKACWVGAYNNGFSGLELLRGDAISFPEGGSSCWGFEMDTIGSEDENVGAFLLVRRGERIIPIGATPVRDLYESLRVDLPEDERGMVSAKFILDGQNVASKFGEWIYQAQSRKMTSEELQPTNCTWLMLVNKGDCLKGRTLEVVMKRVEGNFMVTMQLGCIKNGDGPETVEVLGFVVHQKVVMCAAEPPGGGSEVVLLAQI